MKSKLAIVWVAAAWCVGAGAAPLAEVPAHNGKWNVRIEGDKGTVREGRLVLTDFDGKWFEVARKTPESSACRTRQAIPVTLQKSTESDLEFSVWGTSVTLTCKDLSATVKLVDPKTLEGVTADGQKIRLRRL